MTTVLIIDDETAIAELLIDIVEEYGYTALWAHNGEEGLKLARQHHPELIISDVMMPIMDGYSMLRALRLDPELAKTTVVLVSAGVVLDLPSNDVPSADGFMQKPFDLQAVEQLLSTIEPSQRTQDSC